MNDFVDFEFQVVSISTEKTDVISSAVWADPESNVVDKVFLLILEEKHHNHEKLVDQLYSKDKAMVCNASEILNSNYLLAQKINEIYANQGFE